MSPSDARGLFEEHRESLRGEFLAAAEATGKPRGLRWVGLEWGPALELARDRNGGEWVALASVTLSFEAVEGGDMEGVEAVGNLRDASALFVLRGGQWRATGRTMFNLGPAEVLERFAGQYERIS